MRVIKYFFLISLSFILYACAGAGGAADAPLPPRGKLISYPSPKDSERISKIYYDMLFKRPLTQEDRDFWKTNAGSTVTGQYFVGDLIYRTKNYKLAKQMLQMPADKGFGPAQYECAAANALSKGNIEETYAYFLLASKSTVPDASIPAKAMLKELDKIANAKEKARGKALADNIESAYLPEFQTDVFLTESSYFLVLAKNDLAYRQEQIAATDKKAYADEKKAL